MVQDQGVSNNNQQFLLQAIEAGIRTDGRGIYDYRTLDIKCEDTPGTVQVHLGDTKVIAKISCLVARPFPDRPSEGIITYNTEISALASPSFDTNKTTITEVTVSRTIDKVLHRNRVVDTESLCILAGKKVWAIRVDIHFLDYDGNFVDAACIATITALKHFKRPDVTLDGETAIIHSVLDKPPVPLSINYIPICVTFGFFGDESQYLIVDPSLIEEQVQSANLTLALNNQSEVCAINKAGGKPLTLEQTLRCIKIASTKIEQIHSKINKALAAA